MIKKPLWKNGLTIITYLLIFYYFNLIYSLTGDSWVVCWFSVLWQDENVSRTTFYWGPASRTLVVPDWLLDNRARHYNMDHHSMWLLELSADFQITSMNRNVSKTPCTKSHNKRLFLYLVHISYHFIYKRSFRSRYCQLIEQKYQCPY